MNTINKQTNFMDASKQTAAFGGGYFKTLLTLFILFLSMGVWGQQTLFWRSGTARANWFDSENPWYRSCDAYNVQRPDDNQCFTYNSTFGRTFVNIDNNSQTTMSVNGQYFDIKSLTFKSGASNGRTFNAASGGGISVDSGIGNEDANTNTHTFNVPIALAGSCTFNSNNARYTFTSNFFLNNFTATFQGNSTVSGVISQSGGTGSIIKSGSGTLTLSNSANTFTGNTTVTAGELRLNPSANATFASPVVLNGGTLGTTSITSGRTWTSSSTLGLTANSTIALASATAHTLTFAASNAVSWTATANLVITGWSGTYNGTSNGTTGKIFIGNSASGLTSSQLARIYFFNGTNHYTATQLSTGEIVPTANIALFWGATTTNNWVATTGTRWDVSPTATTYATNWTNGRAAIFNVASSAITIATTQPQVASITANENVTVTYTNSTFSTGATQMPLFVANGKLFNFAATSFATAAGTGIIKNGPGTLQSGISSAYPGGFILNEGMVAAAGVNAMGAGGSLTINGGTIAGTGDRTFTGKFTGGITIGGNFTLGSSTSPASATATLLFDNATALGSSATRTITLGGTGTMTWNGVISGTSSNLVVNCTSAGGIFIMGAANTYTGSTTIGSAATVRLGVANAIPVGNPGGGLILNGGTLSTGATTGFSNGTSSTNNMGTLTMQTSSTIALGTGNHSLYFSSASFTAGQTLTISGWSGSPGVSGTAGKIFIGSSASLTSGQLAQINFTGTGINSTTVIQLSTGEIVPSGTIYESITSGTWATAATWRSSTNNGTSWTSPASVAPSSTDGKITIKNGHTVTVGTSVSIDQVVVESGGTLDLTTVNTLTINDGAGTDLDITGTFIQSAGTLTNSGQIVVKSGGLLRQAKVGTAIPTATWNSGSTCEVTGWTTTNGGGLDQSFSNFTWNCASQSASIILEPTTMSVGGLFKVSSTGAGTDILAVGNTSTTRSLTVGSLQVSGGTFAIAGVGASAVMSLSVTNNCTVDGGSLQVSRTISSANSLTVNGTTTISSGNLRILNSGNNAPNSNVASATLIGNVLVSGGTIDLVPNASDVGIARLIVRGDLTLQSGAIQNTRNTTSGTTGIYFDAASGTQTFTHSGGTLSTASGGIGRRFYYRSTTGPSTINEVYSAGAAQNTVNGSEPSGFSVTNYSVWPTANTPTNNITINNSSGGVTLSNSKTIGTLTLTSGTLDLAATDLTTGSISGGSSASYVKTSSTGQLKRTVTTSSVTFPVGNSAYNPISFANTGTSDIYGVRVVDGALSSTNDVTKTINRRWEITEAVANGGTITPALTFNLNERNNASAFTSASIAYVGLFTSSWSQAGATPSGTDPVTFTSGSSYSPTVSPYSFGCVKDDGLVAIACTPPSTQATIGSYTNNTSGSSVTVNWTRGNGSAGVIVVARSTANAAVDPTSGTSYTANAAFGSGNTTGTNNFVVYSGTGTSVNVTNLTAATGYTFNVYEYNTTGTCYLTPGSSSAVTVCNPATANAGGALSAICQNGTSGQMGGSIGGGAASGTWSGGAGSWTNASDPSTATYTAGASETGSVILTLTTSGGCAVTTATKTITVNQNPTASAGSALAAICQSGTSAVMGGSVGGGATGGTWSGGAGSWTNASDPSLATYTASASESGSITLTLTTSGGSCSTTTATKTITVNQNPTASAGSALSAICQSGTSAAMGGSVGGGATSGTWTGGAGSWTNASVPSTATYTAGASETGTVTLTLTTSGGSCGTTTATKNITVNSSVGGTAAATSSTVCLNGSTSISLSGNTGSTIQWQRSENAGTSWSNISGATSSSYTTPNLITPTSYRATVTNGSCSASTSSTAAVSIGEANTSSASSTTYNGGWSNSQNDNTTGLGAWSLSTTGGNAGFFTGSSDVNNGGSRSWGMYASGGSNVASAVRTASMSIGNTLSFSMDNGSIDSGKTIGFALQNASGENLMELLFIGGQSFYQIIDNAGTTNTSIGYTSGGLDVSVAYTADNTYAIYVTGKGGATAIYTGRTFSARSGGQVPAQIRFFNAGAGSGSGYDLFFNSLSISNPVITAHPSASAQNVCQNGTATALSVTASGSTPTYQWYSNTTASYNGGTLINLATSNSYTPPSATPGTLYYYCVVTNGSCGSATSRVSGAITVTTTTTAISPSSVQNISIATNGTQLSVSTGTATVSSRAWKYSTTSGSGYVAFSPAQTGTTYTPNFASEGTYYVVCEVTYGSPCGVVTSNEVQISVVANSITTETITGSPFCAGATGISVPFIYSAAGNFTSATFKAQLSNSSGSFASPVDLQTVASDGSGSQSISVTIPSNTAEGTGYRIRVVSDNPLLNGTANGTNITINATSVGGSISGGTTVCTAINSTNLILSGNTGSVTKWQSSTSPDFSASVTDITNSTTSLTATNLTATTYYRAVVTNGACSAANSSSATITVSAASVGGTVSGGSAICLDATSAQLSLAGNTGSVTKWQSSVAPFSTWSDIASTSGLTSYTSGALTQTTKYRAVVTNGSCASANSSESTVSVDQSNAASSAYSSSWVSASDDATTGFNSWILNSTGAAGHFTGNSDIDVSGKAWGMFANSGGLANAIRPFTSNMTIGTTLNFSIDNGSVQSGGTVGFSFRNSANQNLMEFYSVNGETYTINDGTSISSSGVAFTNSGLNISITYTAANTYSMAVTPAAGGATTYFTGRTFSTAGSGQVPREIRFFNFNAGSGSGADYYINKLSLNRHAIGAETNFAAQTVCQNATANTLSVTAYGLGLTYQWYQNTSASTSGATSIGGATTSSYTPSTSSAGTIYYYCIVTGNCSSVRSNFSGAVSVSATPTTANAGLDQTSSVTCGSTSVTLAGNTATVGTGLWSIVSGLGGTITSPSSPNSTFTGTAGTTYTLRWTISNSPCTASTDDVVITFNQNPTAANAGADQTDAATCGSTSVSLAGNTPTVGTGLWSIVSGSGGTITTPSVATSTFTGVAGTSYTLRWTISNSPCTASTDDVVITFNQNPTTANAGTDQTVCGGATVTLAANSASVGTGTWSIVSGSGGTITTPSSATSTFTGTAGTAYTLRWTISNSPCTDSTDDVVIIFDQNPTTANAGTDQTVCSGATVTLAANLASVGTGAWSIVSGSGGTITTPSGATSTFTGVAGTSYTLRWTISNGVCSASTDDVVITINQNPTTANAGADQSVCSGAIVTLAATPALVGTGAWSIISGAGGTVTTLSSATSTFTGTAGTSYTLRWTTSNSPCNASTDDVVITFGGELSYGTVAGINTNSNLVISQVYGGGGNGGATYNKDFVEIFNPTSSAVSLTNWKIQYASSAGSYADAATLSGTIDSGKYYLIVLAGGATGAALPTADATGTTNLSATIGKVRLINASSTVIDRLGYGTSTSPDPEGTAATSATGNAVSYQRANNGCTDTNDNASDFTNNVTANPRNSSSAANDCSGIVETDCSGDLPTSMTVSGASGSGSFTYQWYSQSGQVSAPTGSSTTGWTSLGSTDGANTATFTPTTGISSTTTYACFVTPGGSPSCGTGTWATRCRQILINSVTGGTVAGSTSVCSGGNPPAFTQSDASTGSGTLTYQWESSASSDFSTTITTIAGATSTTYDVPNGISSTTYYRRKATSTLNGKACSVYSNVLTITVNAVPTISGTTSVCVNATTQLTGSGTPAASNAWVVASNATKASVSSTGLVTGLLSTAPSATVTYTDINGCTSAASTITVNALPSVTFTSSPAATLCSATSATYTTQSGQSNYVWSVPGTLNTDYTIASGGIGTSSNTVTINWLTSGSKTVTVNYTNSNGCTAASAVSNSTTVTLSPTTSNAGNAQTICPGFSVTLAANTPTTGTGAWSVTSGPSTLSNQFSSTSSATATFTPASGAGSYVLTWTITNGSCTSTSNVTITVNAAPPPTTGVSICQNAASTSMTVTSDITNVGTTFSGTWETTPIAFRPTSSIANKATCDLSTTITRNYTATQFQVSVSGSYTFEMDDNSLYDGMAYLTSGSFTPGSCATGTWIRGDDDGGVDDEPKITASLTAGVTYTLYSTTYSATSGTYTGNFSWTVTPPSGGQIMMSTAVNWYTASSGGTSLGTGTSFNPVGVANSGLANTATAGTTTYYAAFSNNTTCRTATNYVINANPSPSFTAEPASTVCAATDVTYTTQASETNYSWSVPGTLNTDYSITSGGLGTSSNTVTLKWLTSGSKTVTVNYTNSNSCSGSSAASSTITVNSAFTTGTINNTGETICSGGTPTTIGSATASSGGDGTITYSWRSSADGYASAISGATSATYTPPAGLTTTNSYRRYAKDGTCNTTPTVSTGTWTVTVNTNPSAPSASAQSFCSANSPTVASLVATGTAIQWYDAASNGNLLASGIALTTGTYYASQTVSGCESTTRAAATVSLINSGTWLGVNGSWNNAVNWCGGIPTASTNVVISNGNPVLDINHTVASGSSLTLSGTATLTINPDFILTIAGSADFGGRPVTLKSDDTGDAAIGQVNGTLSNATNVTVERYIPGKRAWRALTAPLKGSDTSLYASWQNGGVAVDPFNTGLEIWGPNGSGSSGNGLASGPGYNVRQYTTSGWVDINNTQTTNLFTEMANNAYIVFVTGGYGSNNITNGQNAPTTLKATGELITGIVNYPSIPGSTRHTLIGNPYASPIHPLSILSGATNLFTNVWVWDPALGDFGAYVNFDGRQEFQTYSSTGGSYSSSSIAIQSGQAFFVLADNTGGGSLSLTESMKSSSISNTFRNSNTTMASIFRVGFLKQTAQNWKPLDGCIAGFYEGANAAADEADGKKMINTGENIGFVRNAVNLSSEHYPLVTAQDILNLKIWNTQQAHYKLKLNTEEFTMVGVEAYLQDLYTGTSQQINLDGSVQEYEFDVDPTVSASSGTRFRIVFTNTALAVDTPTQGQLSIYPNPVTGGKVTVSLPTGNFEGCSYQLINVLGQVVRQDDINNSNSSQVLIPLTGLPNSWYALHIIKENSVMYQGKLIIKN